MACCSDAAESRRHSILTGVWESVNTENVARWRGGATGERGERMHAGSWWSRRLEWQGQMRRPLSGVLSPLPYPEDAFDGSRDLFGGGRLRQQCDGGVLQGAVH